MRIDHLMFGAADLNVGSDAVEALFGARPLTGGSHPGLGTRNALLGLENGVYLELIAPAAGDVPAGSFGATLARLAAPALVTFAASGDLAAVAAVLERHGCGARGPVPTQRRTPAGELLGWELLFPRQHDFGSLCPFFIDWGSSHHPSSDLTPHARLCGLTLGSPRFAALESLVKALELPVRVESSVQPFLRAELQLASGTTVLLESSPQTVTLQFG